jgi:hypothetical protein
MTGDKPWKAFERRVGRVLGGHRIPGSGVQRSGPMQGDILHDTLAVECKLRAAHGFHRWYDDIRSKAGRKMAVLMTRENGKKRILVTMDLADFVTLWNDTSRPVLGLGEDE